MILAQLGWPKRGKSLFIAEVKQISIHVCKQMRGSHSERSCPRHTCIIEIHVYLLQMCGLHRF